MKVCIVAGMPGAGKEEFVKVCHDLGLQVIRMGDVVRREAESRGISLDDQGVGGFAHSERQVHGYDVWARRTCPLVEHDPTIIDGCRGISELEVFKREFGEEVKVIAIHASPGTRYERLRARNREDAPKDMAEFCERDKRELGWGLSKVIVMADHMVVNEGTIEEFREKAREVLLGLG